MLSFLETNEYLIQVFALLFGFVVCTRVAQTLKRKNHPLAEPLSGTATLVIPTWLALEVILNFAHFKADTGYAKVVETALGIEIIWVLLTLLKATVLIRTNRATAQQTRLSGLFLDLIRIALVILGAVIVFATVWNKNLTSLLATLGVGSLVVGLALQETLGNLFAGIALVFERPFKTGDWIKVGEQIGEVIETNWRSVRLLSRTQVMLVVPNSVLGRERIENFSQPSKVVGVYATVGFSYADAPNKVKNVLLEVLRGTHGVVFDPWPKIRTKNFGDFAITYEILYFIRGYDEQPDIDEEFKTRLWYAARRHHLTIPYPTSTIFKTEVLPSASQDPSTDLLATLSKVSLLAPLLPEELKALAREVMVMEYGHGERLIEQGDRGDSLFVIQSGKAVVTVRDDNGVEREVAHIGPGEFFGEMALLTGEPRAATVIAESDIKVLFVYKESLQGIFTPRPELTIAIARLAEKRRSELSAARAVAVAPETPEKIQSGVEALIRKMKMFFNIS